MLISRSKLEINGLHYFKVVKDSAHTCFVGNFSVQRKTFIYPFLSSVQYLFIFTYKFKVALLINNTGFDERSTVGSAEMQVVLK